MPDIEPGARTGGIPADVPRTSPTELAWLTLRGWLGSIPYRLGWLVGRAPRWAWRVVRAELVGIWRCIGAVYNWLHMTDERAAIARMESPDAKAKAKREINAYARVWRAYPALGLLLLLVVGNLVLLHAWPEIDPITGQALPGPGRYAWLIGLELLALLAAFEYVGYRPATTEEDQRARRGPLTHGTSSRTLRRDLYEGFAVRKMPDVSVSGLTVNKYGWHGTFETEAPIDDKLVEHLERWVHAPAGSLLVTADPRNAAAHPFKLLIEDPLARPSVPDDGACNLDIRQPHPIGRHLFGTPLQVNLRQHIGLVGRSGSGKSSGLWVLIDRIGRCANAEMDGIDLTNGPALPVWRRTLRRRGTTPDEAASILDDALALATYRNAELSRMAESDEGDLDENWDPQSGVDANGRTRRARFVIIDEFHIVSDDKELLEKVKLLVRIGRKACVYLILATPGASKEDLGSVIIKAMVGLKIIFACVIHDITQFLGGRMVELGWRPDKLAPAAGGNPRDAGKAYVWDGDHQDPEVVRISRLSANDCRERARARGSVTLSKTPETPTRASAREVLDAAFEHFGRERIPSHWLEQFVTESVEGWGFDELRAALRELGVTTTPIGKGPWPEVNPRGYKCS